MEAARSRTRELQSNSTGHCPHQIDARLSASAPLTSSEPIQAHMQPAPRSSETMAIIIHNTSVPSVTSAHGGTGARSMFAQKLALAHTSHHHWLIWGDTTRP